MNILFVHGMGRTPWSSWPILIRLRKAGFVTPSFGYMTSLENFASIQSRLEQKIKSIAASGDYALIGHSLGGVLLRAALNSLPTDVRRPTHVFLLGSPIQSALMARRLRNNLLFRLLAGDCGQLLADPIRMASVGQISDPTTSIVGTHTLIVTNFLFGAAANDGIVSVAEASAEWLPDQVLVDTLHAFLPSSRKVAAVIFQKLMQNGETG